MDIKTQSIDSIGLSVRATNALHRAQVYTIGDMLNCTEKSLSEIRNLGKKSVEEILQKIEEYSTIEAGEKITFTVPSNFDSWMETEENKQLIVNALKEMKVKLKVLDLLSAKAFNTLVFAGYEYLYQVAFLTEEKLMEIPRMDSVCAAEIDRFTIRFIRENQNSIVDVIAKNQNRISEQWDDEAIRKKILELYSKVGFGGLSLDDIIVKLNLPEDVTVERLKQVIGKLLASGELEYVDYRCYRVYGRFQDALDNCTDINERSRTFIARRLQGETLESIAREYGLSRERVRQIVKRDIEKVRKQYSIKTGMNLFDEDYFRYLYETYSFEKKDGSEWLGIPSYVWNYLELNDAKHGKKDLNLALEDKKGLEAGLHLKIKNYLNRNKLYVDGVWIEKKRADLEQALVRKFCTSDVSFDEFCRIYNEYLEQEGIPYDEDIYETKTVYRSRKNHLSDARFLLWKQNEQIRYYDIDGQDYAELLDTLNLDSYENIEFSTVKFIRDYPEIMRKYDIRDQYELHNLLRKIVPEGSYHEFHCGRMPEIKFGNFDRDAAIFDILIDNAPIGINELAELISDEYGYDPFVIKGTYLQAFSDYYHQGIYSVDQKLMSVQNKITLQSALTEDFYYIDEIRKRYAKLIPDADTGEVNPYNLKTMGFSVYSRYAVQNHASLEAFFYDLLTSQEILDITEYRKKFVYVQMFSQKLMELKRNLQVIEFEPNQLISFGKLEKSGVTREMIQDFCDEVYDTVGDNEYFSARSLRLSGFESELYGLGFSDWFYANLLISDDRFSFGNMFGNLILFKGNRNITIKSFETDRVRKYGSIDAYDLMSELTDKFGCRISDKWEVIYKIQDTEVYYDKILDRLYANKDLYYDEFEEDEF